MNIARALQTDASASRIRNGVEDGLDRDLEEWEWSVIQKSILQYIADANLIRRAKTNNWSIQKTEKSIVLWAVKRLDEESEEEVDEVDEYRQRVISRNDQHNTGVSELDIRSSRSERISHAKSSGVDPMEVMLEELGSVGIGSFMGFDRPYDLVTRMFPGSNRRPYSPILLLSREQNLDWYNRDAASVEQNKHDTFTWTLTSNGMRDQGVVNMFGTLSDVISIEIGTFYLPVDEFNDHFEEFGQVSMDIAEIGDQCMWVGRNQRAHFMFNAELSSLGGTQRVKCTNANVDDRLLRLNVPIRSLNKITMRFCSPYERISWLPDRDLTPLAGAVGTPTTLNTSFDHGLTSNDIVYLVDVTLGTNDSTKVEELENPRGHVVTVVNDTSFTIPIDTTGHVSISVDTIIFANRLFNIPITLHYLPSDKNDA